MPAGGNSRTRVTLLGRLRADPSDQRTWAEFVDHYGPRIVVWCRTWDLQDADAQDVTQTVLQLPGLVEDRGPPRLARLPEGPPPGRPGVRRQPGARPAVFRRGPGRPARPPERGV